MDYSRELQRSGVVGIGAKVKRNIASEKNLTDVCCVKRLLKLDTLTVLDY